MNLFILASSEIIYFRFLAIPLIIGVYWIYNYFQKQHKKNKIDEDIKQFKSTKSSTSIEIQDQSTILIEENFTKNPNKLFEEFVFKNSYFSKKHLPQTVIASFILILLIFVFLKFQMGDTLGIILSTMLTFLFLSFTIYVFFEKKLTNLFFLPNDLTVKIWSSKIEVYNLNEKLVFELNSNMIIEVIFYPEYQEQRYGIKTISRHLISLKNSVGLINKKIKVDVVNSEYVQEFYITELLTFSESAMGKINKLKFKEVVLEFVRLNNIKITNNY